MQHDRRTPRNSITVSRRVGLTPAQRYMLRRSEDQGWKLYFVRQGAHNPIPVLIAPTLFANERLYVVLRADGSIDRTPAIEIRH